MLAIDKCCPCDGSKKLTRSKKFLSRRHLSSYSIKVRSTVLRTDAKVFWYKYLIKYYFNSFKKQFVRFRIDLFCGASMNVHWIQLFTCASPQSWQQQTRIRRIGFVAAPFMQGQWELHPELVCGARVICEGFRIGLKYSWRISSSGHITIRATAAVAHRSDTISIWFHGCARGWTHH